MSIVDIVHYETIKPSIPTPPHLNTLKLSVLDQMEGRHFFSEFLFFSATPTVSVDRLKTSLSQTLTLFYPFAGRIVDNQYVDCNDRGVNFFQTRVNTQMENVLANPISDYLLQFTPNHDHKLDPTALLSVQINIFECGRMALCASITHQMTDASSLVFFFNTWAAITRGDAAAAIIPPKFCASSLFPPEPNPHTSEVTLCVAQEKLVSKRFVFNASDIAALQAKCCTKLYRPTRAEAVTAYMWRCAMNAAGATSSLMMPAVNLRTRMDPPLPISSVGNLILGLLATATTEGGLPTLAYLADRLHQEITKIDANYVRKLQQVDNGFTKLYDSYKQQMIQLSSEGQEASYIGISSLSRFPFYEADFGWGKPEWATILNLGCTNIITLMDTRCGTGIEAWVNLTEQRMSKFECNPHLHAFSPKL